MYLGYFECFQLFFNSNVSMDGSDNDKLGTITLQENKTFSHEGGTLEIVGSSVHIRVPKGAINKGESKNITVKVKLCRPNDWECLQESGHTVALPQIELGPNGSQFNKPIEVLMENNTASDEGDDVTFEFTDGSVDETLTWLPAVKCNSRKEAKLSALTAAPHVSFAVADRYLHAFYLHFTGGRKKMKIPKYKWLQSTAYIKTDHLTGDRIALKVVFHEATKEGKTVSKSHIIKIIEFNLPYSSLYVQLCVCLCLICYMNW